MLLATLLFISLVLIRLIRGAPIASDLTQRAACSDVAVLFARGTTEPGTLGIIAGPPFRVALQAALGSKSLSFTGINYPANVAGFLVGGDKAGSQSMADAVSAAASSCPDTKIVMAGYSQGAQLVHNAAALLPAAVQQRVNAVVVFGDPDKADKLPGVLEARRKTFCATGDLICAGQAVILPPHLSYGSDAGSAASFVASKV